MTLPPLKGIREIVTLAQAGPAASLPDETHQSYPIPLPRSGSPIRVLFLFSPSHLQRGTGLLLSAPNFVAVLSATTGEVLEKGPVTPDKLGVRNKPGEVLGAFRMPEKMSSEEYSAERERLYDAYDALLLAWAAEQRPGADPRVRNTAREFTRLFDRLSEAPLLPYYRSVGAAFFGWVRRNV